ncbi:LytR/AlgR family response regulator transcription factor [Gottfriedia sp. NPDC058432]|uniref:LytR/AlgR family response regulator transcription factor n=1 Tax=Gottfriedia sp. NPDC058432 TaxID=3346497 RepID=UPI00365DB329
MKICICDDDILHSMKLEEIILDYTEKFHNLLIDIDVFSSPNSLIKRKDLGEFDYQILFLDIEMNEMNGIDVAREIRKQDRNLLIIYVTSYNKYTIESFEVSPFRYLLKPVDSKKIKHVLSIAIDEIMLNNQYLFFKLQNIQYQIKCVDIISISSENGRMIRIITCNGEKSILFYGKIKELEKKLNPLTFVKVNQGTIVNLNYIYIISGSEIYLSNNDILTISRGQKKIVKETYHEFISKKLEG